MERLINADCDGLDDSELGDQVFKDGFERRDGGPSERTAGLGVAVEGAVEVDGSDISREQVEGLGCDSAASEVS